VCRTVSDAEVGLGLDDDDALLSTVLKAPDEAAAEEVARDDRGVAPEEGKRERLQGYPPPRS
jgi:hypothetical protein